MIWPLNRFVIAGAVALALLAGFGFLTRHYYNKGWYAGQDALQTAVEKRNHEAAQKAQESRNEMDKCYDAGRDWDQSRGVCKPK